MSLAVISLALLFLTSAAFAQMTPGVVLSKADDPFPFVAKANADGLDDLIERSQILVNNGTSFTARNLALSGDDHVVGVLDVNGDGIPNLLTDDDAGKPGPHTLRLYIADAQRRYPRQGIDVGKNIPHPMIADADGKDDLLFLAPVRYPTVRRA